MKKLLELTEKLIKLNEISHDSNGVREYSVEQGSAFAVALKHNEEVAVAQAFLSKDTIFPYHNHTSSNEVITVYHGTVTVVTESEKKNLNPGDTILIKPGEGHMLHAHTDVKLIAITIPPDANAMPKK